MHKSTNSRANKAMLPILLTTFIDQLGFGIVIPVLPALLLDLNSGIFPKEFGLSGRSILLGLLIAAYPLAQFIGAPILGSLSDRYGRKKILLLSLIGTFIGYAFFGMGILVSNIWILFISRILDGFTGGNMSTIYSSVADISTDSEKPKRFGLLGMMQGIGLIAGPIIGGYLSDKSIFHLFHYSGPFWFVAGVTLINIVLVVYLFPETLTKKIHAPIDPFTGFKNIIKAYKVKNLRTIFLVSFLISFGLNLFVQFFSFYLINKFRMSQSEVGNLLAYVIVWAAISQGVIAGYVSKKVSPTKIVPISAVLLAVSIVSLVLPGQYTHMLILLPFVAIFQGLAIPNVTTLISQQATSESQGEVMGINQSVMAVTQIIPPIIDGILFSMSPDLPMIGAGVCVMLGWFVFVYYFDKNKRQKFAEV